MEVDRELRALAERQHGVLTFAQAKAFGSRSQLRHRFETDDWERLNNTVVRLVGSRRTSEQQAMVAVLTAGPGSVLSHRSAAALWDLPGFRLVPPEVSRLRATNSETTHQSWIHEPRRLPGHHITVVDDIPVTTPVRTLFDLAAVLHPDRTERLTDTMWAQRLVTGALLHDTLAELAKRGRTGIGTMRAILSVRGRDYVPPASGLESRVASLLREHGLPEMRRQVDLGGECWLGRVDFVEPASAVVLEVQSDRYHAALLDRQADLRRAAALERAGFRVLEVSESAVWHRPSSFLPTLRRTIAERRRPRRAA